MIVVSHRGNLAGPSKKENTFEAWKEFCAVDTQGVSTYCELDLWYHNGTYWLGHDKPVEGIGASLLWDTAIVWHCKNFAACKHLSKWYDDGHYFFHENDPHTMTSQGWIWAYPGQYVNESTVIVCKDLESTIKTIKEGKAMGICTDYVLQAIEAIS